MKTLLAVSAALVVLTDTRLIFLRETALIGVYAGTVWLAITSGLFVLRARIFRFFGMISYALYLFHELVLVAMHSLLRHAAPSFNGARPRLVTGLAFTVTVALCAISWKYLEKPLVSWGHRRYAYEPVRV